MKEEIHWFFYHIYYHHRERRSNNNGKWGEVSAAAAAGGEKPRKWIKSNLRAIATAVTDMRFLLWFFNKSILYIHIMCSYGVKESL